MQQSAEVKVDGASTAATARWTDMCGNPECKTGWLRLFRNRSIPRFEEKWACSAACTERMVSDAVRSQIESWVPAPAERASRMPLGLILLSRGWISHRELQDALAAQRRAGHGRIGEWLHRLHGVSEETVAKGLAIQWSCAVLPSGMPGLEPAPALIPAFLRKRYHFALWRQGPDAALYLAGKYRPEHAAARAVEHILREPVHAAFIEDRAWCCAEMDTDDPMQLESPELEIPGRDGAAAHISELIERVRPYDARLVRVHDHLWLRMWFGKPGRPPVQVRDVVLPLQSVIARRSKGDMDCLEQAKNPGC
jgi:hypothetical protein